MLYKMYLTYVLERKLERYNRIVPIFEVKRGPNKNWNDTITQLERTLALHSEDEWRPCVVPLGSGLAVSSLHFYLGAPKDPLQLFP